MAIGWKTYRDSLPDGTRPCKKCGRVLPFSEFHRHAKCHGGYNSVWKECRKPISQAPYQNTSLEKRLYNAAKSRAAKAGREFDIDLSDIAIPTVCPVLGINMETPSLDRINSSKGYVKGNVRVISMRANMLKSNATIEELTLIIEDLKRRK